jgi:hypothetical protein
VGAQVEVLAPSPDGVEEIQGASCWRREPIEEGPNRAAPSLTQAGEATLR